MLDVADYDGNNVLDLKSSKCSKFCHIHVNSLIATVFKPVIADRSIVVTWSDRLLGDLYPTPRQKCILVKVLHFLHVYTSRLLAVRSIGTPIFRKDLDQILGWRCV